MHSKPRGDFLAALDDDLTLEAQIVRISDAVAYLNHDLADAFRAGILSDEDLPGSVAATLGSRHSQRIDTIVCDIIDHSYHVSGINDISGGANGANPEMPLTITMGDEVRTAFMELREFMFDTVYMPNDDSPLGNAARQIVRFLHQYFSERTRGNPARQAALGRHHAAQPDRR